VIGARRFLQRLLPVAVSAITLAWVLQRFDLGRAFESVTWRVGVVMVPALLLYGAITLVLEAQSVLRVVDAPPGFGAWTAARIKCASYLLAIINYALGGAAFTYLLNRRAGIGLGRAASVVIAISVTDLVVVAALAAAGTAAAGAGAPTLRAGVVTVACIGFFAGIALLRAPGSLGPVERLRSLAVFDVMRDTPARRLASLGLLRLLFTLCFAALGGATFYAFGIPVAPSRLIAGMMILALIGALPIAVAGLGTGQIGAVWVFRGVADADTLVGLSLVLSAGMIALRAAMGAVFAREFAREAFAGTRGGAE
jgi:hypothetical protein